MEKNNTKIRLIFNFLLWILFGILIALLPWYVNFDDNSNFNDTKTNKITDYNVLNTVFSWLNNIKLWNSPVNDTKYNKFEILYNQLEEWYFDEEKIDYNDMMENSFKWFVEAINDPYTVYFTVDESDEFHEELEWSTGFEWIWAVVTKRDGWVLIEEVYKWSPAMKSWLLPLDIIIEVDSEKTWPMTLTEAVSKIRGPKWTDVILTIFRKKEQEILEITVTRDKITIPSVSHKTYQLTGWIDIWYIELANFGEDTEMLFRKTIDELKKYPLKWIVLDLRWNGWWYLETAVKIASHFIPKWKVVVDAKYRIYPEEIHESKWYWDLEWFPIVVLIDWLSASASEILAEALRNSVWAKVVWTTSFGKWTIQSMYELEDWTMLKYTIWKWFTSEDINIDEIWVEPDVEIEFDRDSYLSGNLDNQLEMWKNHLYDMISDF